MLLLLNINNTFTKVARWSGGQFSPVRRVPTQAVDLQKLTAWRKHSPLTRCVVSCVVPSKLPLLRKVFADALLEVGPHLNLGNLVLDYPGKSTLGPDRLASLVAATHEFSGNRIILDCGTAITLNFLTKEDRFIGGVIAPGLQLFSDYLQTRTALLPKAHLAEPDRHIGRTTQESVDIGVNEGFLGMLSHLLTSGIREVGWRKPLLIATGGDAKLFASRLPFFHALDEALPLRGLVLLSQLNP